MGINKMETKKTAPEHVVPREGAGVGLERALEVRDDERGELRVLLEAPPLLAEDQPERGRDLLGAVAEGDGRDACE
jgi:hypothetical protein